MPPQSPLDPSQQPGQPFQPPQPPVYQQVPPGQQQTFYGSQQPGQAPVPVAPRASSTLAIIGLILAFFFAPAGLIVSIIALAKHKSHNAKIIALIGVILSGFFVLVTALLILLVTLSYGGIQTRAQDTKHKIDIQSIQSQIEGAAITAESYPTLAQLNDSTWRSTNMPTLDKESVSPKSTSTGQLVSADPTDTAYAYAPAPTGCDGTKVNPCTEYKLSAHISTGADYVVTSFGL